MNTSRRRSREWQERTEVIVCENQREAVEHWRQDRDRNEEELEDYARSNLQIRLRNGTRRLYMSGQHGVERLMGLEIDSFHNLIRDEEHYWEFEDFLRVRVQRSALWREGRERREREERSVWTQIAEEWRLFLSRRVGKLIAVCMIVLVVLVSLLIIQQIYS